MYSFMVVLFNSNTCYDKDANVKNEIVTNSITMANLMTFFPFSRLIAVELPSWFSTMSLALESDVNLVRLCKALLLT